MVHEWLNRKGLDFSLQYLHPFSNQKFTYSEEALIINTTKLEKFCANQEKWQNIKDNLNSPEWQQRWKIDPDEEDSCHPDRAAPAPTTAETLRARRDALAAKHAELLRELTELRASEAFALAQADDNARAAYAATHRAALTAERDRLRHQLTQLAAATV